MEGICDDEDKEAAQSRNHRMVRGKSYVFAAHTIQAVVGCHFVAKAISAER
jgi:hypothetical protein